MYFRRHVCWSSTLAAKQACLVFKLLADAEVTDFNEALFIDKQILQLDVSVHDQVLVAVPQTRRDLDKKMPSMRLFQLFASSNVAQ